METWISAGSALRRVSWVKRFNFGFMSFEIGSAPGIFRRITALTITTVAFAGPALALPSIGSVSVGDEKSFAHGNTLVIQGQGFGEKTQAAPVLFDHVSHAWENGVLNRHHTSFTDMQRVVSLQDDPRTLWAKPSNPSGNATGMLVAKSRAKRTPTSTAQYYAFGANNWVGWPMAHGGTSTPPGPKRLYVSWWLKPSFDLRYYFAIPADAKPSQFITNGKEEYGEEVTVDGTAIRGRIIAHDTEVGGTAVPQGWLFIEFPGHGNANSLKGKTIRGASSNAQVVFPDSASTSRFIEHAFISPRGKWARLWDTTDGNNFRFSLGNRDIVSKHVMTWHADISPVPQAWNRWEIELDYGSAPRLSVRLNNQSVLDVPSSWADVVGGVQAPTVALLGLNDFMPRPFSIDIDDIYIDSSFHRVVLADSPNLGDARIVELQRPVVWSAEHIEAEINVGALHDAEEIYAFVFDFDGTSNSRGFLVCDDCAKSPASPEDVSVQ